MAANVKEHNFLSSETYEVGSSRLPLKLEEVFNPGVLASLPPPSVSRSLSASRVLEVKPSFGAISVSSPSRPTNEIATLSTIRRMLASVEEKVAAQINQSDRLREAGDARLEEKMCATEEWRLGLNRRMAELTGSMKGLSDEMQMQIRRGDNMDEGLSQWRHRMEGDMRKMSGDFDQSLQKVASSARVIAASSEEDQKRYFQRFQRIEEDLRQRTESHDQTRQHVFAVSTRLDAVEDHHLRNEMASSKSPSHKQILSDETASALVSPLERRLEDIAAKVDRNLADVRGLNEAFSAHEQQIKGVRTQLDMRGELIAKLNNAMSRNDRQGGSQELSPSHLGERQHNVDSSFEERLARTDERLEKLDTEFRKLALDDATDAVRRLKVGAVAAALNELGPKILSHEQVINEIQNGAHISSNNVSDKAARVAHMDAATDTLRLNMEQSLAQSLDPVNKVITSVNIEVARLSALCEAHQETLDGLHDLQKVLPSKIGTLAGALQTHGAKIAEHDQAITALRGSPDGPSSEVSMQLAHSPQDDVAVGDGEVRSQLSKTPTNLAYIMAGLRTLEERFNEERATQQRNIGEVRDMVAEDLTQLTRLVRTNHGVVDALVTDVEKIHMQVSARVSRPKDVTFEALRSDDLELQEVDRALEQLRPEAVDGGLREDVSAQKLDLLRVDGDVATLHMRLDALVEAQCSQNGGDDVVRSSAQTQEIRDLVSTVKEHEVAEHGAYQRVVARIDALCEQLVALEGIVSASTSGIDSSTKTTVDLSGLVSRVEERFEEINGRFDEMDQMELTIESKLSDFMEQVKDLHHGNQDSFSSSPSSEGSEDEHGQKRYVGEEIVI